MRHLSMGGFAGSWLCVRGPLQLHPGTYPLDSPKDQRAAEHGPPRWKSTETPEENRKSERKKKLKKTAAKTSSPGVWRRKEGWRRSREKDNKSTDDGRFRDRLVSLRGAVGWVNGKILITLIYYIQQAWSSPSLFYQALWASIDFLFSV